MSHAGSDIYRADPAWQAAREAYVADLQPGEDDNQALQRRTLAARTMYEIEHAATHHEGATP